MKADQLKSINDGYHRVALRIDNIMAEKNQTYWSIDEFALSANIDIGKATKQLAELMQFGYIEKRESPDGKPLFRIEMFPKARVKLIKHTKTIIQQKIDGLKGEQKICEKIIDVINGTKGN